MNARQREASLAAVRPADPVDMLARLTTEETNRVETLRQRPRVWLLNRFRTKCREHGRSSLGRMFAEWTPGELAKALVLLDRPAPMEPSRFNVGGTYSIH